MATETTQLSTASYAKAQSNQAVGKNGVINAIRQASDRTGVDFSYLLNKADQESSMNPNARASTSSASGLFQFIKSTWLKMVKEHGAEYGLGAEASAITEKNGKLQVSDAAMRDKILNLRHDPILSSAMAAEFTKENKDHLDASVGGNIGSTELYMAHFLGAGGAEKFLKTMHRAPNAPAADFLPQAADANPNVFYSKTGRALSLKEIYNRFAAKFDTAPSTGVMVASAVPPTSTRDLAVFSAAFYHSPDKSTPTHSSNDYDVNMDVLQQVLKQNSNTSDTLFNTMLLAQSHMSDVITGVSEKARQHNNAGSSFTG